ncbi:MAG: DUF4783 domain-containing protein [Bacteroidetes bacterium]|nr:DUF4783 domain-containing protein [Bacteroidota bacterium]
MKYIFLLIALFVGTASFSIQPDTDAIVKAFKTADATEIGGYFDDFIDLKLLDKEEVKNMGRNQATIALKTFFDENHIKGFEKGSDREIGNTLYITGKLTSNTKSYNVTVMLKAKANKHQIITMRIN